MQNNLDRFKFRVWDNHEGAYIQDLVNVCHINSDGSLQCFSYGAEELGNIGDVIEQCTGLKDCKGQLIYEGDIVARFNKGTDKREIVYQFGCFGYLYHPLVIPRKNALREGIAVFTHKTNETLCTRFEVIGNIHENKEMLG